MNKQPNPNSGLSAKKRRIAREQTQSKYDSIFPIRSERRVDDNDKVVKFLSYRNDIFAKDPDQKVAATLKRIAWVKLLQRQKRAARALMLAQRRHDEVTSPAMRAALYVHVTAAKEYVAAIQQEIANRSPKFDNDAATGEGVA